MALADLNRSNDTPISTLKLSTIVPKDFPTLPAAVASMTLANQNAAKPRYTSMTDWGGAATPDGEDPGLPTAANQPFSTAAGSLANSSGGANEADYAPRTQSAKLAQTAGQVGVIDVTRSRGPVAPAQRYPVAGDAALAAPVVTSISPNTAVHGAQPLVVTITGTGFTPYSRVITGGTGSPWDDMAKYLSATQMTVTVDPRGAVAGTSSIAVEDHSVLSNTTINFTFT